MTLLLPCMFLVSMHINIVLEDNISSDILILFFLYAYECFKIAVMKKKKTIKTYQTQTRRAKAFVISVLGGFAQTCQSKQVLNTHIISLNLFYITFPFTSSVNLITMYINVILVKIFI